MGHNLDLNVSLDPVSSPLNRNVTTDEHQTAITESSEDENAKIAALNRLEGNNSWGHISESDFSEVHSEDDTLVEKSVVPVEGWSNPDFSSARYDWFIEEALPLGRLFGV